jgi:hypothetical protein
MARERVVDIIAAARRDALAGEGRDALRRHPGLFVLTALSAIFVVIDIRTTLEVAGPETGPRAGDPECRCPLGPPGSLSRKKTPPRFLSAALGDQVALQAFGCSLVTDRLHLQCDHFQARSSRRAIVWR